MDTLVQGLRRKIAAGTRLVGAPLGPPPGEADFVVIHNASRFGAGLLGGMLPFGDANAIALEIGREAIPKLGGTPVVAGLSATDPTRVLDRLLDEAKAAGFAGIQNFPTVGLIDGTFRKNLEEAELGYGREVEMIRRAAALGLFTVPFVFTPDEAARMAQAGADAVVVHPGLGPGADPGRIRAIAAAARGARKGVAVLAIGPGPEPAGMNGLLRS